MCTQQTYSLCVASMKLWPLAQPLERGHSDWIDIGDKMSMETNLSGRVRNTKLPITSGLLPLYDAVVNSIHAIDEREDAANHVGSIVVEISRDQTQRKLDFDSDRMNRTKSSLGHIRGFKITDDGIGFNDDNMKSFMTLDSDYKASKGGRGVGRLLWLKAFGRVHVGSVFESGNGVRIRREFDFTAHDGVINDTMEQLNGNPVGETVVELDNFEPRYRDNSSKSARVIARGIVEHCLWYFLRPGGAPDISVVDGEDNFSLQEVFEGNMYTDASSETVEVKGTEFELTHVKRRIHSTPTHYISYCADNRLVTEEKLNNRIPGMYGKITDDDGGFAYSCYVSSTYLDEHARPERTGFEIMDSVEGLLGETEISLSDIREVVVGRAKEHLSKYLTRNIDLSKKRVEKFVSEKAPRYRPILSRIPNERLSVDPEISDKELDLLLHGQLKEIESELLSEGHDIMGPRPNEQADVYRERLAKYLQKAEDIKKSDLANYVAHRRVILDLLDRAIRVSLDDGTYAREELIHELIMPMRTDSREVLLDSCNLWIVDERLAFHNYLASDKTLASMPITDSNETNEPDLCALNLFDNPVLAAETDRLPLASIVVVEIKKPMRNDARTGEKHDPVEQALGYLERIRDGKVKTARGRPIPRSEDIPGFCYVLCDLTTSVQKRCKMLGLTRASDGMGYFTYNSNYNAYVEVISYDKLVNAAKQRNRAFFDKLGLPS